MTHSINPEIALKNIDVLETFKQGDIPVTHPETGELSKENWKWGRLFKRYYRGFNPEILKLTFETVLSEQKNQNFAVPNLRDAVGKVLVIKSYYDKNRVSAWLYSNRMKADQKSKELKSIYRTFSQKIADLNTDQKMPRFQRSTSVYVGRIIRNGKEKAVQTNMSLIEELKQSFAQVKLNHVETAKNKAEDEEVTLFNTSMIDTSRFDDFETESEASGWSEEESSSYELYRQVSMPPREMLKQMALLPEFRERLAKRRKVVG